MVDGIGEHEVRYLRQAGCPAEVIRHCLVVAETALAIAGRLKIRADRDLIREGALHHDIGRAVTGSIRHAVEGAELAKRMGMNERIAGIIERHIGAGIPAEEARALGLPDKDYVPETPEEIIVAYADNLVQGERVVAFAEAYECMKRNLGSDHPGVERFMNMHETIASWTA